MLLLLLLMFRVLHAQDCVRFDFEYTGFCIVEVELNADLMVVVDSSNSVDEAEMDLIKQFLKNLIGGLPLDNVRVGVLQFATGPVPRWKPGDLTTLEEYYAGIDGMVPLRGATWTETALDYTMDNMFDYSRDQYLLLVTDAIQPVEDQIPCNLETGESEVDLQGTNMFVVGVGEEWQEDARPETYTCLTDRIAVMTDWQELAEDEELNREVIAQECGPETGFNDFQWFDGEFSITGNTVNGRPSYRSNTEKTMFYNGQEWQITNGITLGDFWSNNGGNDTIVVNGAFWNWYQNPPDLTAILQYQWNCLERVYPTISPSIQPTIECESGKFELLRKGACRANAVVDVIFVVDSSSSIRPNMYSEMQNWMISVVGNLSDSARVGVMQFERSPSLEWNLDEYSTIEEVQTAIFNMERLGGATYTNTKEALEFALDNMLPLSPNERDTLVFLITDGIPSNGDEQVPCELKPRFEAANATVLVVGIGEEVANNIGKVDCIASSPDLVFTVGDFFSLNDITGDIGSVFCVSGTPFDGMYYRSSGLRNGKVYFEPMQKSALDYELEWSAENSKWQIGSETIGLMYTDFSDFDIPPEVSIWYYEPKATPTVIIAYDDVYFECLPSPPTLTPTTDAPSHTPSVPPSRSPTITTSPTRTPSIRPSADSPSKFPTSDSPSRHPSTNVPSSFPTSDSPTNLPSSFPTTDSPSLFPTTESPSFHPTTEDPSFAPTATSPSNSPSEFIRPSTTPSVPPSMAPTVSSPSYTPTRTPSIRPSADSPSTFPTSDSPSLFPTTEEPSLHPLPTAPSSFPTSDSPTNLPTTDSPSFYPSTEDPSSSPTSSSPSSSPTQSFYRLHVLVSGLVDGTSGSILSNLDSETQTVEIPRSASYFIAEVPAGQSYSLTTGTQPDGQICAIESPVGVMPAEDVTLLMFCSPLPYDLAVRVSGLKLGFPMTFVSDSKTIECDRNGLYDISQVSFGSDFEVQIGSMPEYHTCTLSPTTGTMVVGGVILEAICAPNAYDLYIIVQSMSIGYEVSVANLYGEGQVLTASTTGQYFMGEVPYGEEYSVLIEAQTDGHICTIDEPSGVMTETGATVTVTCGLIDYALNVDVQGLISGEVSLSNSQDSSQNLVVTSDGVYQLGTLKNGDGYGVVVLSQPEGHLCTPQNPNGISGTSDTTIVVICSLLAFDLSVNLNGLILGPMEIRFGDDTTELTADGIYQLGSVAYSAGWILSVVKQPPGQICSLEVESGTMAASALEVGLNCVSIPYHLNVTITGIHPEGSVTLIDSESQSSITATSDGSYSFGLFPFGNAYSISVSSISDGLSCSIHEDSGVIPRGGMNVEVTCTTLSNELRVDVSGALGDFKLSTGDVITSDGIHSIGSIPFGDEYAISVSVQPEGQFCTVTDGEGIMKAATTTIPITCTSLDYELSVDVSGLIGTLELSSGHAIDSNGIVAVANVSFADSYNIEVTSQPTGQTCSVTNGEGVMPASNVVLPIVCTSKDYELNIEATGVLGLVVVMEGYSGEQVFITESFTSFWTYLAYGSSYEIAVIDQSDAHSCVVKNDAGIMPAESITVLVECTPTSFDILVDVKGLASEGSFICVESVSNNALGIIANGIQTFGSITFGSSYAIGMGSQPQGQNCVVSNGAGTMGTTSITVTIICTSLDYLLSVDVSGLIGTLELSTDDMIDANGLHAISNVTYGDSYSIQIASQPSGQTCGVSTNNEGAMPAFDVVVSIECTSLNYPLNIEASGLMDGGFVIVTDTATGTPQTLFASGNFLLAEFPFGTSYSVVVSQQSEGQQCTVTDGEGMMGAEAATIKVQCAPVTTDLAVNIQGLVDGGSFIVTESEAGAALGLSANGVHSFGQYAYGSAYSVQIVSQPQGQNCTISNPAGIQGIGYGIKGLINTTITITCVSLEYKLDVDVSGLIGTVELSTSDDIDSNGVSFVAEVTYGESYSIEIDSNPTGQICTVGENNDGSMPAFDVTVKITCVPIDYELNILTSGILDGGFVIVTESASGALQTLFQSGSSFLTMVPFGSAYSVVISQQSDGQSCTVIDGEDVMGAQSVTVEIQCEPVESALFVNVAGLAVGGSFLIVDGETNIFLGMTSNGIHSIGKLDFGDAYSIEISTQPEGQICTIANGVGIMGATATTLDITCESLEYELSVEVSGLIGSVELSTSDEISSNGVHVIGNVPYGQPYSIKIESNPTGQTCIVSANGDGVMPSEDVTVQVTCSSITYELHAVVNGVLDNGYVIVKENTTNAMQTFSESGTALITMIPFGSTYSVVIADKSYGHTCNVRDGEGVMPTRAITVEIECQPIEAVLSVRLEGLAEGGSLQIRETESDSIEQLSENGIESFGIPFGWQYGIEISTQPEGQFCTVSNGVGTIDAAEVIVDIVCVSLEYSLSVEVNGLIGTVQLSTLDEIDDNGVHVIGNVVYGESYSIKISQNPTGQLCSVLANGEAVMPSSDVSVEISCTSMSYELNILASGIIYGGFAIVNESASGAQQTITQSGSSLLTSVPFGSIYSVLIDQQSEGHNCSIVSGEGVMAAQDTTIEIQCVPVQSTLFINVDGLFTGGSFLIADGITNTAMGIIADGIYTFGVLDYGEEYSIEISFHPKGQVCTVLSEAGIMGSTDITIDITCEAVEYTLSVDVSGLMGTIELSTSDEFNLDGVYMISNVKYGESYSIEVASDPIGQTCTISDNNEGVMPPNDVVVEVICSPISYELNIVTSGILDSGFVIITETSSGALQTLFESGNSFLTLVPFGSTYSVVISQESEGQSCTVIEGEGIMPASAITVEIQCAAVYQPSTTPSIPPSMSPTMSSPSYTPSRTPSIRPSADSPSSHPSPNAPSCSPTSDSPTNLPTTDSPSSYPTTEDPSSSPTQLQLPVFLNVTGLAEGASFLAIDGKTNNAMGVTTNGIYDYGTMVSGEEYSIDLGMQPPGQVCTVFNGVGTMETAPITVDIICVSLEYELSVEVSGLIGTVQLSTSDEIESNGLFSIGNLMYGDSYSIQVTSNPIGEICTVSANGNGNMPLNDVVVEITCAPISYELNTDTAGIDDGSFVLVVESVSSALQTVFQSGMSLLTLVPFGSSYSVIISQQSAGQICTVLDGDGVMPAQTTTVHIQCEPVESDLSVNVTGLTQGGSFLVADRQTNNAIGITGDGIQSFGSVNFGSRYSIELLSNPVGQSCKVHDGAGKMGSVAVTVDIICVSLEYELSVEVSGLIGTVELSTSDQIDSNGRYVIGNFTYNEEYSIEIASNPAGQICTISENNEGSMPASDVVVEITCSSIEYDLNIIATGVLNSGFVVITESVSGALRTVFGFQSGSSLMTKVPFGSAYSVVISQQSEGQSCTVLDGDGIMPSQAITVEVQCDPVESALFVNVVGLAQGGSFDVTNSETSNDLGITANGIHSFGATDFGEEYSINIATQPEGQFCTVADGTGIMGSVAVTVDIICDKLAYELSVEIIDLIGVVELSSGEEFESDGIYFIGNITYRESYSIEVATNPIGQTCTLSANGQGVMPASPVMAEITCTSNTYKLNVDISGVSNDGFVTITESVSGLLSTLVESGSSLLTLVPFGTTYSVVISEQSEGLICTVLDGEGEMGIQGATVHIRCEPVESGLFINVEGLAVGGSFLAIDGATSNAIGVTSNGVQSFGLTDFGQEYSIALNMQPEGQVCTVSDGTGIMGASAVTVDIICVSLEYELSVEVSGLIGSFELSSPGEIDADGIYVIGNFTYGESYSIEVVSNPTGQTCDVSSNSAGSMPSNDVLVSITCSSISYPLNVVTSGVQDGGFVIVTESISGTPQTIFSSGTSLLIGVPFGSTYSVVISQQSDGQSCTVSSGEGTMPAEATTVQIQCEPVEADLSVNVDGLITGGSLTVIENETGDEISVSSNGIHSFGSTSFGDSYSIEITSQPEGQMCVVTDGIGTMGTGARSVPISCVALVYNLSVNITGLSGTLELSTSHSMTSDGLHAVDTVAYAGSYSIEIASQPIGQTCTVSSNNEGTMPASDVVVFITCESTSYDLNVNVIGLPDSGFVFVTESISGAARSLLGSGSASLTLVPFGADYSVAVAHQSQGQDCTVIDGTGKMPAETLTIDIQCEPVTATLSVNVVGLQESGAFIVAESESRNALAIDANGIESFGEIGFGISYSVVASTNPLGQTCSIADPDGIMGVVDIVIEVQCSNLEYDLIVSVSGLEKGGFITLNDGVYIYSNGVFTIGSTEYLNDYSVFITDQGDRQTCIVSGGSGTQGIGATTVFISCETTTVDVIIDVISLPSGSSLNVVNSLDQSHSATLNSTGTTNVGEISVGSAYSISVENEITGYDCLVSNGTGQATTTDVVVFISCSLKLYTIYVRAVGLSSDQVVVISSASPAKAISTAVDGLYTIGDAEYGSLVQIDVIDPAVYNFIIDSPTATVWEGDVYVTVTFSTESPSLSPTIFESESPTTATRDPLLDCQFVKVTHYGNCKESTQDYIVLVDSDVLSLADYLQVQTYLRELVELQLYGSGARLGYATYNDAVHEQFTLTTPQEYWIELITGAPRIIGGTSDHQAAFDYAVSQFEIFGQSQQPKREPVLIVISDEVTSVCDSVGALSDVNVINVFVVSQDSVSACFGTTIKVIQYADLRQIVTYPFTCVEEEVNFESIYSLQHDRLVNDKPVFESEEGWVIRYGSEGQGEVWTITDDEVASPTGEHIGSVVARSGDFKIPDDMVNWDFVDAQNSLNTELYKKLRVYCFFYEPSVSPTSEPTTPYPTYNPSRSPTILPSNLPTIVPSIKPTVNCEYFTVGASPCDEKALDLIFVVDSSSSIPAEDYETYKEGLSDVLANTDFPDDTNIGLLQFATIQQLEVQLGQFGNDTNQVIDRISEMDKLGGETYTHNAMLYTLLNMWPSSEEGRSRVTVLFTDGEPNPYPGQDPCVLYNEFIRLEIDIYIVGIGEEIRDSIGMVDCLTLDPAHVLVIDDFLSNSASILEVQNLLCPTNTPFDGGYERTDEMENGYAVYENLEYGHRVSFNGNYWVFEALDGSTWMREAIQSGVTYEERNKPADLGDWLHYGSNGMETLYDDVRIVCTESPQPSVNPTIRPTFEEPSSTPTSYPTSVAPSNTPSSTPSTYPTKYPFLLPTGAPTTFGALCEGRLEKLNECEATVVELEARLSAESTAVAQSCYNDNDVFNDAYSLLFSDGPVTCSTLLDTNTTQNQALQGIANFQSYASLCLIPLVHTTMQYSPENIQQMTTLVESITSEADVYIGDLCPETCEWLCDATTFHEQCGEASECATEVMDLKARIIQAEADIKELAPCHESVAQALEDLKSDLNDWKFAVEDGGLSCNFVPSQFCEHLPTCTLVGGECL